MASFIGDGNVYTSPSTISISSLLASCSLGSSSTSLRSLQSSIQYKDKLYNSASKALEAYIEDFEESLLSPEASTGQICIRTVSARLPSIQKSVSREWRGKPCSFSSVSRRRFTSDPELASLTTDDLLGFASDGSLPVDQTYMLKLNSKKPINGKDRPSLKKLIKSSQRSSSLDRNAKVNFYNVKVAEEKKLKSRDSKKMHTLDIENAAQNHKLNCDPFTSSSLDWKRELVPSPSSKDYPRWLTSQKSDLNVSGITSISDIKYPIWLKNYDLLSDSGSHVFSQTDKTTEKNVYAQHTQSFDERFLGQYEPFNHIPENSSNNTYSENDYKELFKVDQHAGPFDAQRLPFKGSSLSRHAKEPFKDDQIELLLLKAERTLESSNRDFLAIMHKDCSPQTEDILEADRSWEKIPVTFKSPVPVFCEDVQEAKRINHVNEFHKDGLNNERQEQESTLSGGKHHGPVEALKQMLFNLQTVQQNFARDQSAEENVEIKKISAEATSESKLFDQEMMPVNNSLQKALHHLSRLKELVEESNVKQAQESPNLEEEN